jgi:hypothetical protein
VIKGNVRKALNRLFVIASFLWVLYITFVYPYRYERKVLLNHNQKFRVVKSNFGKQSGSITLEVIND